MADGDISYALCVRCADQPYPVTGSVERRCEHCTALIWVSPSTRRVNAANPDLVLLCTECGLSQMEQHAREGETQILPMGSAQAAELIEHGLTLDEIQDIAERAAALQQVLDDLTNQPEPDKGETNDQQL